ncbi:MAG: AMP-binding protein [Pseudomonadales bacterium]|nr:AMP-binding protein [Pseudomonadales bacterium]
MTNVYNLFSSGAKQGTSFIQDGQGNTRYSYDQFDALTSQYANLLRSSGVKAGDRVMVQVEKSPESLLFYFACLRFGCIYLPLNTAYKVDELVYFVNDAEPTLILCDPKSEALFRKLSNANIYTLDNEGNINADLDDQAFDTADRLSDDVAVIIYTSGTTGRPKGAMISHGNIESNSKVLSASWGWQCNDVMLHALPIYHVHGLFVGSHLPVMNGSPIIFLNRFDAAAIVELLPTSTVYMGVPTNYTRLLAQPELGRESCKNMRLFISGSAPLLTHTFNDFNERAGHTIIERYGMSETGMNTSNPLNGNRKGGTVGPPLAGIICRIVDDEGIPVAKNDTGHLELKGPNVFSGYWRMPEKTAAEFSPDGFFKTGDLASEDEDGYISIVGRNKDLIISGGLNVYPKEIETLLDNFDGVAESAVIGLPDPDFGEAVSAIIVTDGTKNLQPADITAYVKEKVANFKATKHVFFVDELPRNAMGKVQKNKLREMFT